MGPSPAQNRRARDSPQSGEARAAHDPSLCVGLRFGRANMLSVSARVRSPRPRSSPDRPISRRLCPLVSSTGETTGEECLQPLCLGHGGAVLCARLRHDTSGSFPQRVLRRSVGLAGSRRSRGGGSSRGQRSPVGGGGDFARLQLTVFDGRTAVFVGRTSSPTDCAVGHAHGASPDESILDECGAWRRERAD